METASIDVSNSDNMLTRLRRPFLSEEPRVRCAYA